MKKADLRYANLQHASLHYANLEGADLRYASLKNAGLENAHLCHADLRDAHLEGANMENANLQQADMRKAYMQEAELYGANLKGANIDYSCLPLWCGSLNANFDSKQLKQIAYHLIKAGLQSTNATKKDKQELSKLIDYANSFHRAKECGFIAKEMEK